jgi:cobalt-zinc-cadmium efflux system membrane fusion protein
MAGVAPAENSSGQPAVATPRRGLPWIWIVPLAVVIAGGGAYAYRSGEPIGLAQLGQALSYIQHWFVTDAGTHGTQAEEARSSAARHESPWDGLVAIDDAQSKAIGLRLIQVTPQTDPIKLELTGRTAYNPNSLVKVRSRFDALVEKVHVELGQHVKRGEPLVDLFSTELAKAKNDYQTKYVQWQHDLRLLSLNRNLAASNAISQQKYVDSQNDERKSHLDYATAATNLRILGVPESEIEPLVANLGDTPNPEQMLNVAEKARMTMRAQVDGIIISRDVVPGNLYDETNVLLTIAPLESLWVLANVYEVDQAKVAVGQRIEIRFPFLQQTTTGAVEHVSSEVSRETRAVQVRASIPNPGGRLKADMLVKASLEIPPQKGQTSIARQALVVINGEEYVFVKRSEAGTPAKFERRRVEVAQENSDFVVIASGLNGNETVAGGGSLILAQLYEDKLMVETGMPTR